MIEIDIIEKNDFCPSTVTIAGTFNVSVDISLLSNFLPVIHIFDSKNNRVKRESGSRQSLDFFGLEKAIISICYKHMKERNENRSYEQYGFGRPSNRREKYTFKNIIWFYY